MSELNQHYLFTSESVTEGHPDKICDQISDAVLDAALAGDTSSRVACESMVKSQSVYVMGEITTKSHLEIEKIVRDTVHAIGYTDPRCGFTSDDCKVEVNLSVQSDHIAMGVDKGGAGDQGLMFGYACDETPELMPFPITMAHRLCQRLAEVRRKGILNFVRPDGKSQVTVEYRNFQPARVEAVVVSTQHTAEVSNETLREGVLECVIKPVIPAEMLDSKTKFHINPTGRFVIGGPMGDAGLTGRKIIVDTYGGYSRHGGGALSGKDPTKVDRSACYMARYVAKNIVAAGLATKVEVQLAYAIGVAEPVSVMTDTFGTGVIPDSQITELIRANFKLTPKGIIETLDLRRPIYRPTAAYGHFGRSGPGFTWEKTDKADAIRKEAGSRGAVAVSRR